MNFRKAFTILSGIVLLLGLSSCDLIIEILEFDDQGGTVVDTEDNTEFMGGAEGWVIEGDANQTDAEYSDSLGLDNSGYIFAKDNVTGGVWYFVAPSEYLGDRTKFFNGYIQFYLIQESALSNQFNEKDVIIDGGEQGMLIAYFDTYPGLEWTYYKLYLNESGGWYNELGFLATDREVQNVLSNIEKLSIRGEYESGPDTGGLDSFSFSQ